MAGARPGVHVVKLKSVQVSESLIAGNKFIKWGIIRIIGELRSRIVSTWHKIRTKNNDDEFLEASLIPDDQRPVLIANRLGSFRAGYGMLGVRI